MERRDALSFSFRKGENFLSSNISSRREKESVIKGEERGKKGILEQTNNPISTHDLQEEKSHFLNLLRKRKKKGNGNKEEKHRLLSPSVIRKRSFYSQFEPKKKGEGVWGKMRGKEASP